MQLPKPLASISVRLTALHLALSALSLVVVGIIVSLTVEEVLTAQMRDRLVVASGLLEDEYQLSGVRGLEQAIRRQTQLVGSLEYRLETPDGQLIVGDLPAVPRSEPWTRKKLPQIVSPARRAEHSEVLTYGVTLGGGEFLVVGEEVGSVSDAQAAVLLAFGIATGAVVVIGLAGGVLLNAAILKRVGRMADTARAVMAGDLTKRIDGGGARDELGWLATVFNHMLDQTANLIEINRHIGAAIAHDLRSPLAHLRNRLEAVRLRTARLDEYEDAIEDAVADVNQILATFNAILRIAQVESGTRRTSFRRLDIGAVLANVAEAFAPVAQDHGQEITISGVPEAMVDGDQELLTQLFANLIENAIRHAGPGAHVSVSCTRDGALVRVVVADDGPGIPVEDRERVLERFVRLDRSRSTQGSGLGLTLCTAIVELHSGTLRLDDNRPGLRCIVEIPTSNDA